MTYGPFYPTSLVNESQGGAPWTISGATASASISGEGVTDFLVATGFNADVPSDKVVTRTYMRLSPDPTNGGFNIADQYVTGFAGNAYTLGNDAVQCEDAGMTPSIVNDPSFGFKFSLYAESGGNVSQSLALYVDVE